MRFRVTGTSKLLLAVGLLAVRSAAVGQSVADGILLANQGKLQEAGDAYRRVLERDGKDAEAHYRIGLLYLDWRFKEKDFDQALDHMKEAAEINPNNAEYQFGLGRAYGMVAQNASILRQPFLAPKVKKAFERSLELNPNQIEARIGLAQYYFRAPSIMGGDTEKGWRQLDTVQNMNEFTGRAYKAVFYEQEKKVVEAEREWKALVQNYPGDWKGWKNLGYFCLRQKRFGDAVTNFRQYVRLRPDTADSFDSLGEGLLRQGDADGAIENCRKALSIDDKFASALLVLGEAYEIKGMKQEARNAYERLLSVDANEARRKSAEKKLREL